MLSEGLFCSRSVHIVRAILLYGNCRRVQSNGRLEYAFVRVWLVAYLDRRGVDRSSIALEVGLEIMKGGSRGLL